MSFSESIGVAILAAGNSSRLGRPKQLVEYKDTTLLQNTIDAVGDIALSKQYLVLGANAADIIPVVDLRDFQVLTNKEWVHGIASSINIAVHAAQSNPEIQHLLILLSDQPFVSTELIWELITVHERNKKITTCGYAGQRGVPAIFSKDYFEELMELHGDVGAKSIIKKHYEHTAVVDFELGTFDIDTEEDVEKLKQHS